MLHCASLLRTIFASLARANECVHIHNVRDFPQYKVDSEINARFLLKEHGDQKSMATFSANEINSTAGDITGPLAHVQIMFPLKDKKCMVFQDIFSGT